MQSIMGRGYRDARASALTGRSCQASGRWVVGPHGPPLHVPHHHKVHEGGGGTVGGTEAGQSYRPWICVLKDSQTEHSEVNVLGGMGRLTVRMRHVPTGCTVTGIVTDAVFRERLPSSQL